mgnify:CR=1 FL=1
MPAGTPLPRRALAASGGAVARFLVRGALGDAAGDLPGELRAGGEPLVAAALLRGRPGRSPVMIPSSDSLRPSSTPMASKPRRFASSATRLCGSPAWISATADTASATTASATIARTTAGSAPPSTRSSASRCQALIRAPTSSSVSGATPGYWGKSTMMLAMSKLTSLKRPHS